MESGKLTQISFRPARPSEVGEIDGACGIRWTEKLTSNAIPEKVRMPRGNVVCLIRVALFDGRKEVAVVCDDPRNMRLKLVNRVVARFEALA